MFLHCSEIIIIIVLRISTTSIAMNVTAGDVRMIQGNDLRVMRYLLGDAVVQVYIVTKESIPVCSKTTCMASHKLLRHFLGLCRRG